MRNDLGEVARRCRIDTLKALWCAQSGHPGSSLSAMDTMVALYHGDVMRYDANNPDWRDRDYFVLSVGHAAPGLYSCLAHAGFKDVSSLAKLRELGSGLEGHAKRGTFPGVEASSGSLGQGLCVGVGLALGLKVQQRSNRVFVLMSDGEQEEGSTWEAAMSAAKWELPNLVAIVDKNGNQINGPTNIVMPSLDPLGDKYEAFGWKVRNVNGNDLNELLEGLAWADSVDAPAVLVSHTTTGYPISFMMGDYHWHHGVLTDELFLQAMEDLGEKVNSVPDESWLPGGTLVSEVR